MSHFQTRSSKSSLLVVCHKTHKKNPCHTVAGFFFISKILCSVFAALGEGNSAVEGEIGFYRHVSEKKMCANEGASIQLAPYYYYDNGKEFAEHEEIAQGVSIDFYFAKPYHPCERGVNENTNGLVQQYFPKGTSFETITSKDIEAVQTS